MNLSGRAWPGRRAKGETIMKTVAVVNNKGGVGKTTSAVNLAAGIATENRRVLLVDLDAQGSASLSLGLTRGDLWPGTAEVILDGLPIQDAIRPSSVRRFINHPAAFFWNCSACADW